MFSCPLLRPSHLTWTCRSSSLEGGIVWVSFQKLVPHYTWLNIKNLQKTSRHPFLHDLLLSTDISGPASESVVEFTTLLTRPPLHVLPNLPVSKVQPLVSRPSPATSAL